jgi:hypothetical protein
VSDALLAEVRDGLLAGALLAVELPAAGLLTRGWLSVMLLAAVLFACRAW